jgi:hypothetical protein
MIRDSFICCFDSLNFNGKCVYYYVSHFILQPTSDNLLVVFF